MTDEQKESLEVRKIKALEEIELLLRCIFICLIIIGIAVLKNANFFYWLTHMNLY